jgi:hypothetical protein
VRVRLAPDDEVEPGGVGECHDIPVARQERQAMIDAALRDEGITQAGLPASGQNRGAQPTRARPVAFTDVEEWNLARRGFEIRGTSPPRREGVETPRLVAPGGVSGR